MRLSALVFLVFWPAVTAGCGTTARPDGDSDARQFRAEAERLAAQVEDLEGELARVEAESAGKSEWIEQIRRHRRRQAPIGRTLATVDTVVIRADEDLNVVQISIGPDDELSIGDVMTVYRGNEYVGRLVIHKKGKDRAVGHMDLSLTKSFPKKGDSASTRL